MPIAKRIKPVRAATLADVGREAGVSAMAASAVLNSAQTSSRIAPETRERILRAAKKLRYRPNAAARALANRRMDTLGVATVFDGDTLNHYFLEVLNGILSFAAEREQNVTVFTLHDWGRDPARLHDMCDGRIDGLILVAPTLTREAAKLLPAHTAFVSLHANNPLPNVLNIEADEERGAREMVEHLISRGHRRIMHIAGTPHLVGAQRRVRAYKQALAGAGIAFDPNLLLSAEFSTESGLVAMRTWLKQNVGAPLPEAVFCANDGLAVGCIEALAEVGVRVPDDVSVTGFDDSVAARSCVPQLTTVKQPLRAMGARAVEHLLAQVGDEKPVSASNPIVFPTELVLRASVAAPRPKPLLVPAKR